MGNQTQRCPGVSTTEPPPANPLKLFIVHGVEVAH